MVGRWGWGLWQQVENGIKQVITMMGRWDAFTFTIGFHGCLHQIEHGVAGKQESLHDGIRK